MFKKVVLGTSLVLASVVSASAQKYKAIMQTTEGTIEIILNDKTPLHSNNFVKLAQQGFYDSLLFHRVIPEFMIQGGDPTSKNAPSGTQLGSGSNAERIPAEFDPSLFHKNGALAAARDNNPQKASSDCQFYIVVGKRYKPEELVMMEQQMGYKFSEEQKKAYEEVGGTPFLDNNYTVYGQVVSGMEAVNAIVAAERNGSDRPNVDRRIKSVKILELNAKGKYVPLAKSKK